MITAKDIIKEACTEAAAYSAEDLVALWNKGNFEEMTGHGISAEDFSAAIADAQQRKINPAIIATLKIAMQNWNAVVKFKEAMNKASDLME